MSGHDMSMGASGCQISMLWNWYTIDVSVAAETVNSVVGSKTLLIASRCQRRAASSPNHGMYAQTPSSLGQSLGYSSWSSPSKDSAAWAESTTVASCRRTMPKRRSSGAAVDRPRVHHPLQRAQRARRAKMSQAAIPLAVLPTGCRSCLPLRSCPRYNLLNPRSPHAVAEVRAVVPKPP